MQELWGGHECTVNRARAGILDQTRLSGHDQRLGDLDLFAALGLKAIRYPVLWEHVAPERPDLCDWRWTDERLARLRALGIRPIAGLAHHGGGPAYTHLLDESFAVGLAAHAAAAAARYPWIEAWTPVNEPVTTARFSALYGHWHPHRTDERAFWLALLNQIDATRLAMRAVRRGNPAAQLIQTEDLGKTYSTRAVAHQADYDNQRRWMSWDLLTGRVVAGHPLWERLCALGLGDRLRAIADDPCPPDIIGVNHYLTSDRYLDHRLGAYPADRHGGNGLVDFVDVEAVRVLLPGPDGLEGVLQEAWDRYGLPLAVTEVHNGCTRDEQMRWMVEAWRTAERLNARGVTVRAVTAWSLLGAYDWNSLLTQPAGHYESGVYDLRGPSPRPTAMVGLLKGLATGAPLPPAARGQGWWRRDVRLAFQPAPRWPDAAEPRRQTRADPAGPPLLIVGATGTLGKALARACEWRGLDYVLTARAELDLADPAAIAAALDRHEPWAVINAAGWVRVDAAEADPDGCHQANAVGALALARACAGRDLPTVAFSSDLVFDGRLDRPYVESDAPNPLNVYGRSKAAAETGVLTCGARALIIRTAAFFSPYDPHNFAAAVARDLSRGRRVVAADDLWVSPTYVPDLVDATLDLLIDGETGLWHLTNQGEVSWADFAGQLAGLLDLNAELIDRRPATALDWPARRPARAALTSERGLVMPNLDNALRRHVAVLRAAGFAPEEEARIDRLAPIAHPVRWTRSAEQADRPGG